MKKNSLFTVFSVAFIVIALFVSCAENESASVGGTKMLGVNLNKGSAKSLKTVYDGFNENNYVWFYKTSTTDKDPGIIATAKPNDWTTWTDKVVGYKTPTNTATGVEYADPVGLRGAGDPPLYPDGARLQYDYSAGGSMWQLELQAKKRSGTDWVIVYEGKTDFFKVDGSSNGQNVYVPLNYLNDAVAYGLGSIALNHGGIKKLDDDYDTTDSDLTWTTRSSLYRYDSATEISTTSNFEGTFYTTGLNEYADGEWSTYTNLEPTSYIAKVTYNSYGVLYEIADTVNVHSNLTATVSGSFQKRLPKIIKVCYHDGQIINADGTQRTETNMTYSGKDALTYEYYTFEKFLSLPSTKTDDNISCVKDGYTFAGWYTTDTTFTDDNRTPETAYLTEGFVRTNTNAEGYLKQAIFVDVDGVTTKADLDFVLAYTTMTDVLEENWFYEIHLFARWIPNTVSMTASTTARDNIILNYTSYCNVNGFDASANITINTSQTEIQGFTSYSDIVIYADKDYNFVFVNSTYKADDALAKTKCSEASDFKNVATRKFVISGFYDEDNKIVITNDGTLGRKGEALSKYLDKTDDGWIHQGGLQADGTYEADAALKSGEVMLYAYWREIPLV